MKSKTQLEIGSILGLISKKDAMSYYDEQDVKVNDEPEFKMDEAVIYSNDDKDKYNGYYSHKEEDIHYCFISGRNSLSTEEYRPWAYVKKDKTAKSFLNWIENTGVAPDCKKIGILLCDGVYIERSPNKCNWELEKSYSIEKFLILEV